MVNHGHIAVNGKRVDIPSYQVTRVRLSLSARRAVVLSMLSRFWRRMRLQ